MTHTRSHDATPTLEGDGHNLAIRLVAWDRPSDVTDNGRDFYAESFQRGGLVPVDGVVGEVEHGGVEVAVPTGYDNRPDGLYATARVSRSQAGRDLVEDLRVGLRTGVSVEFDDVPLPVGPGGTISRSTARLQRWAFTTSPQHADARVVAQRSHPSPTEETPNMTTPTTDEAAPVADIPDPQTATRGVPTGATVDPDAVTHTRAAVDTRTPVTPGRGGAIVGPRFRSLGHYILARAKGEVEGDEAFRYARALSGYDEHDRSIRHTRALDSATSPNIPGLVHEEWIRQVIDEQGYMQPTIESFTQNPLPESGDAVAQPRVSQRPLVGVQSADGNPPTVELTEIRSRAVQVEKKSWPVETFAGGQNMSLQTVLRSSPEYLTEVTRLHLAEMAEYRNRALVTKVVSEVPAGNQRDATAGASGFAQDINTVVVAMLGTSGAPSIKRMPEFVLLSTTKWKELADLFDSDGRPVYPTLSPVNPQGTLSVTSPEGAVRDLRFRVEPELPDGNALVSFRGAAASFIGGTQTLSADVPSNLGRDVAVFSFMAYGERWPAGLHLIKPGA